TADTIQVATDDDEVGLAMYWFTDAFAQKHPHRVAYLLREDRQLPGALGPGGFKPKPGVHRVGRRGRGDKALYVVSEDGGECDRLDDRAPPIKVPGRRVPDVVPWLLGLTESEAEGLVGSVVRLHAPLRRLLDQGEGLERSFRQALAEAPADVATWGA